LVRYYLCVIIIIYLSALFPAGTSHADVTVSDIYRDVEALKIGFSGYTLGARLNGSQKEMAQRNRVATSTPGTYKFKNKRVNIVADSKTDRVVIIFETLENASQQQVRDMVGSLTIAFKDPTLSAHDKIVYWAYGKEGKYSSAQFEAAKEQQKTLPVIATVKLQSEVPIMERGQDRASGRVYYIVSSEPLLKQFAAPSSP